MRFCAPCVLPFPWVFLSFSIHQCHGSFNLDGDLWGDPAPRPQSFVVETAMAVRSAMFGHAAMEPHSCFVCKRAMSKKCVDPGPFGLTSGWKCEFLGQIFKYAKAIWNPWVALHCWVPALKLRPWGGSLEKEKWNHTAVVRQTRFIDYTRNLSMVL